MRELRAFSGTLSGVRWALLGTLTMSIAVHGAVVALFLVPRSAADAPRTLEPPPENAGETFEPLPGVETVALSGDPAHARADLVALGRRLAA